MICLVSYHTHEKLGTLLTPVHRQRLIYILLASNNIHALLGASLHLVASCATLSVLQRI